MKNLKHTKIKNTAVVFEVLTRRLVTEAMEGKATPSSLKLIQKHFNAKSILFKELALYRSLLQNKNISEQEISKYLDLVVEARKRLPETSLKKAKYNLIKDLKTKYGDEFLVNGFNEKLREYREMASIYKLFEYDATENPTDTIECRRVVTERLMKGEPEKAPNSVWETLTKDVRVIGFKKLIEKFNEKYDNLLPRQKKILTVMINKPTELKECLNKELVFIEASLKPFLESQDEVLKIKLKQVTETISSIKIDSKITDEHISSVMKCHNLLEELKGMK